jgi:energy-coupling factor transport system ATP-binding protein
MPDAIITVEHLSHTYATAPAPKLALDDVSLQITRGACVAIIGVNGSGKSTLVQHFNGLLRPSHGSVTVDGVNVGARHADLRLLRQQVGLLFQFPESQIFASTIYADVAFGPQRMHLASKEVKRRVQAALDIVGLPFDDYAERSPFDLSGGQRRRVALAGILSMSPRILILDEPTVGLDGEGRADFYAHLERVRREQGVTIILISHDMAEVAAIADQLYILHRGKLVMAGPPRSVFAQSEQLQQWDLAAPSLHTLFALLRQQGIAIPESVLNVDEASDFLQTWKHQKQLPDG